MKTDKQIAKDAIKNFNDMVNKMSALANGNGHGSRDWPDEETLFPPLHAFLKKNKELSKELDTL